MRRIVSTGSITKNMTRERSRVSLHELCEFYQNGSTQREYSSISPKHKANYLNNNNYMLPVSPNSMAAAFNAGMNNNSQQNSQYNMDNQTRNLISVVNTGMTKVVEYPSSDSLSSNTSNTSITSNTSNHSATRRYYSSASAPTNATGARIHHRNSKQNNALSKSKGSVNNNNLNTIRGRSFSSGAVPSNQDDNDDGGMEDEYGEMDDSGETFITPSFQLESGAILKDAQIRYNIFGDINEAKDNIVVVCHALTGNSNLDEWWGTMLGEGKPFDTSKYAVVCANVLGSCYGSTGSSSINPDTGKAYGIDFPSITIRDTVKLQMQMIKEEIGASSVYAVIGGSMGGMQALEWAIQGGDYVKRAMIIGCGPEHTAWQIAISEVQRQAVYADPKWNNGDINPEDPPSAGLSVARQMAMISYRTNTAYDRKFGRDIDKKSDKYQVRRYLEYQGEKFLSRFDAITYVKLTEQMDSHDICRNRGTLEEVLLSIKAKCHMMAMDSDILYPPSTTKKMADIVPTCTYSTINTKEGHDGFLLEYDQVGKAVEKLLKEVL